MRTKAVLAGWLKSFLDKLFAYSEDVVYRLRKENFAPFLLLRALLFISPDSKRLMIKENEHVAKLNRL